MELHTPSRWRCVDFISDLHLQADEPQTFQVWSDYLQNTTADAVFILGDLFEVWVGDDVLSTQGALPDTGFELQCALAMRTAAQRTSIYIMRGNRDFLMGSALMKACACTLLEDPTVLEFGAQRWLLTHGDALCLDDINYMQFRAVVRGTQWQRDFLEKPLQDRMDMARHMRSQSEALKRADTVYADIDTIAAQASLASTRSDHMIHGHTHRPGCHTLGHQRDRWVLSDWDMSAQPPRAEVLRLSLAGQDAAAGVIVQRISPDAATVARLAD